MKILIAILFMQGLVYAGPYQFNLQITEPDFTLKNYPLDDKEFRPFMQKTSWRCFFGETKEKGKDQFYKNVRCNYSVKKVGEFTTKIVCGKNMPFNELHLDLLDEKKNLTFKIYLFCKPKA